MTPVEHALSALVSRRFQEFQTAGERLAAAEADRNPLHRTHLEGARHHYDVTLRAYATTHDALVCAQAAVSREALQ